MWCCATESSRCRLYVMFWRMSLSPPADVLSDMAKNWISTEGSSCSSVSYPSRDNWQNVGKAMQSPSKSMLRSSLFWDVMQFCTFWDNLSLPSSRVKQSRNPSFLTWTLRAVSYQWYFIQTLCSLYTLLKHVGGQSATLNNWKCECYIPIQVMGMWTHLNGLSLSSPCSQSF